MSDISGKMYEHKNTRLPAILIQPFPGGGGGRKFFRVQRHANIYKIARDTDLGHRDIPKYNFFFARNSSLGYEVL